MSLQATKPRSSNGATEKKQRRRKNKTKKAHLKGSSSISASDIDFQWRTLLRARKYERTRLSRKVQVVADHNKIKGIRLKRKETKKKEIYIKDSDLSL